MERLFLDVTAFASTNLDDILVLTILFAQAATARERSRIVLGQYLGIFLLMFLGMAGAFGLSALPDPILGLLGLVPMAIGIHGLVQKEAVDEKTGTSMGILSVTLVTFSNGADNIGVYIPLFIDYSLMDYMVLAAVFAVMIALWCLIARNITRIPAVERFLRGLGPKLVPYVMIALGIWILLSRSAGLPAGIRMLFT